jgi:hypothetical protein
MSTTKGTALFNFQCHSSEGWNPDEQNMKVGFRTSIQPTFLDTENETQLIIDKISLMM